MSTKPYNAIYFSITIILGLLLFQKANALTIPSFSFTNEPIPLYSGDTGIVTVIPDNFIASSTKFSWFVNDVPIPSVSGLGKNSIRINTARGKSEYFLIRVRVEPGPQHESTERQHILATMFVPIPQSPGQTPTQAQTTSIRITASPKEPSPEQNVRLELEYRGVNLNFSKISWYVDNKLILSGVGETSAEFKAGKSGEDHTVVAEIIFPDKTTTKINSNVSVNELDLYWWADTVVPAWYKGKSLPVINSKVIIMAIPSIQGVQPNNLLYKWLLNDNTYLSKSGFGKSTYELIPQFEGVDERITVEIKDINNSHNKDKTININTTTPVVHIYQMKPLEGVDFSKTISYLETLPATILDFIAEIFFLPIPNISDASYIWTVGGRKISSKEPAFPNIISIRSSEGFIPEKSVVVKVQNKKILNTRQLSNGFRLKYR